MRKSILIFVLLITLSLFAFAILNGDFDLGSAFWTEYTSGSGSVAYRGNPQINQQIMGSGKVYQNQ